MPRPAKYGNEARILFGSEFWRPNKIEKAVGQFPRCFFRAHSIEHGKGERVFTQRRLGAETWKLRRRHQLFKGRARFRGERRTRVPFHPVIIRSSRRSRSPIGSEFAL